MKNTNNTSNNISRNNTNFGKSSEIKPEHQKILNFDNVTCKP